jgi:hypothetical protein
LTNIFVYYVSAIVIQAWHSKVETVKLKFPKLTSERQVSFVNEAPLTSIKQAQQRQTKKKRAFNCVGESSKKEQMLQYFKL